MMQRAQGSPSGIDTRINSHPFESKVIYPSGNFIIVRNIVDESDHYIYRGHSTLTTACKFSPNVSVYIHDLHPLFLSSSSTAILSLLLCLFVVIT